MKHVLLLLLCSLFLSPTLARFSLCAFAANFGNVGSIDGFGRLLSNSSWLDVACQQSNYDSGWLNVLNPSALRLDTGVFSITKLAVRRIMQTNFTSETLALNITVEFAATVNITSFPRSITYGQLYRGFESTPLVAIAFRPISWTGKLLPSCNNDMLCAPIFDLDLFDDTVPKALAPAAPSRFPLAFVDVFRQQVTDVNLLLGPLESAPSTLHGSVRGSFLVPSSKPAIITFYGNDTALGISTVVQFKDFCIGTCGEPLESRTKEIIEEVTRGLCNRFSVLSDSVSSFTESEFLVDASNTSIQIRHILAVTRSLVQCGDLFIGIELTARVSATEPWSISLLFDPTQWISMVKSLPVSMSGSIYGAIQVGGVTFTVASDDIFSFGRGGSLLPDFELDFSVIQTALLNMSRQLKTDIDLLDDFVDDLLHLKDLPRLVAQYSNITTVPRIFDFFQWLFRDQRAIKIVLSDDATSATVLVNIGEKLDVPFGHEYIAKANNALKSLGNEMKATFGSKIDPYTIPSIDQEEITHAVMSVLLKASIDLQLSSNGTQQVFVNVTSLEFTASTDIQTMFGGLDLFSAVHFLISPSDAPYVIADVTGNLSQAISMRFVGFINDQFYPDQLLNLQGVRNAIASISQQMNNDTNYSWLVAPLPPFNANFGRIASSVNFHEGLKWINTLIDRGTNSTIWLIRDWLMRLQQANADVKNFLNTPLLIPNKDTFTLSIKSFHLVELVIPNDNTKWRSFATGRLKVPTLIESTFVATLNYSGQSLLNAATKALTRLNDWAIPMRYQMVAGSSGDSTISVEIDLPSLSKFNLTMIMKDDNNDNITFHLSSDKLLEKHFPSFDVESLSKSIEPTALLLSIKNGLVQFAPFLYTGALNIIIPPMQDSLGSIYNKTQRALEEIVVPWLLAEISDSPFFELQLCQDYAAEVLFNLTINGVNVTCNIVFTPQESLAGVVQELDVGFKACRISTILAPRISKQINDTCGEIGIYPAIAGLVRNLIGAVGDVPVQYEAPQLPTFGSWKDLSFVLQSLFKTRSLSITQEQVEVSEVQGLIPADFQVIFTGDTYDVVFLEVDIPLLGNDIEATLTPKISAVNRAISLTVPSATVGTNLHSFIRGRLGAVFNVPGITNISAFSNLYDSETGNITLDTIITAPNNTFDLLVQAQFRNASHRYMINYNATIILQPGRTFQESMTEGVISQVNDTIKDLLVIRVDNTSSSSSLGLTAQIRLTLMLKNVGDGNAWILPVSLAIANSQVPGLSNFTNHPTDDHFILSDLSINGTFDMHAAINGQIQGLIGSFVLANGSMSANVSAQVNVHQVAKYSTFSAIVSALVAQSNFSQKFLVTTDVHSSVDIFGYNLTDFENMHVPEIPSIGFLVNETLEFINGTITKEVNKALQTFNAAFNSTKQDIIQIFDSLAAINQSSLCNWTNKVITAANRASSDVTIPFTKLRISDIIAAGLIEPFNKLHSITCELENGLYLRQLCNELEQRWKQKVCRNIRVANSTLNFELVVDHFEKHYFTSMEVDIGRLWPSVDSSPLRGSSTLSAVANISFFIPVEASLSWQDVDLTIGDDYQFVVELTLVGQGTATAFVGPLVLTLGELDLQIGSPARILISQTDTPSITGSGTFFAVVGLPSAQCDLLIEAPDFSNILSNGTSLHIKHECREGFSPILAEALRKASLTTFFGTASRVLGQLEEALEHFIQQIGLPNINLNMPLIGTAFSNTIKSVIKSLTGPIEGQKLAKQLIDFINSLQLPGVKIPDINQKVIEGFTKILCKIYALSPCPAVPIFDTGSVEWPISVKRQAKRTIDDIHFSLGEHGTAALDLTCDPEMQTDVALNFILVFNTSHGLSIKLPSGAVFQAGAMVRFASSEDVNCALVGKIGFLAAKIRANDPSGLNVNLTIDSSLQPNFHCVLALTGQMSLGISDNKQTNSPLPHFDATVNFDWPIVYDFQFGAPKVTFSDIRFCVGSLMTGLVEKIIDKAKPVLDPFKAIIGRDGILLKQIGPTRFIFGRPLTLVELMEIVATELCSSCSFDSVYECLNTFVYILDVYQQIQDFGTSEGCATFISIRNFELKFADNVLKPLPYGSTPPDYIRGNATREQLDKVQTIYNKGTTGKFGIIFPLATNVMHNIVQLLLGHDIELVSLTIPSMYISAGIVFPSPIFPPVVMFEIGVSASIKIELHKIMYTSIGIRNYLQTHDLSSLSSGLAIPTKKDDGSPIWQFQGSIRLSAGVYVNIFVYRGRAYVFLQFDVLVGVPDLYNRGFMTFEELFYNLQRYGPGALQYRLQLSAGFGVHVEACFPVLFKKICFTMYSIEESIVLVSLDIPSAANLPLINNEGSLNLEAVNDGPSTLIVYESQSSRYVTLKGSGSLPSRSASTTASNVLGFYSATSQPLTLVVRAVRQQVLLPPNAMLNFVMSATQDTSQFFVTPTSVISNGKNVGVAINNGCSSILLSSPKPMSGIQINGLPCPIDVETTESNTVTLEGSPALYTSKPITLQLSLEKLISRVQSTEFTIDSSKVTTTDGLAISYNSQGSVLPSVSVYGHYTQNTTFTINNSPPGRKLSVIGGSGNNVFKIPDVSQLNGVITLTGGTSFVNYLQLDMMTPPEGLSVVAGANAFVYQKNNTILWTDLKSQKYNIHGRSGAMTNFTLLDIADQTTVDIHAYGAENSTIIQQVTGCSGSSELRISLNTTGNHIVNLGNAGEISNFACTVRIIGGTDDNQIDTVVIQATNDLRNLEWTINRERIVVFDRNAATKNYLFVFFNAIERVVIQSNQNTSHLNFVEGTWGTEFVIEFPESPDPAPKTWICTTSDAVVIRGSTNLFIGPNSENCAIEYDPNKWITPLYYVGGLIAIDSSVGPTNVFMSLDQSTHPQRYGMDHVCLSSLNSTYHPLSIRRPSSWICDQIGNFGAESCPDCQIAYFGDVTFNIVTGPTNDYFSGFDITAALNLQLGNGDDYLRVYGSSKSLNASVGFGFDKVSLSYPLGMTNISLGYDEHDDSVDIFALNYDPMPQIIGNSVGPVNRHSNDMITINNWNLKDLVFIHATLPPVLFRNSSGIERKRALFDLNKVSNIALRNNGGDLKMDLITNRSFIVTDMTAESTITFLALNNTATNWIVKTMLPSVTNQTYLNVLSTVENYGTAIFVLPETPDTSHYDAVLLANGTIQLHALSIYVQNVDNLEIDSQHIIELLIDGSPFNADLVVSGTAGSMLTITNLSTPILAINVTAFLSTNLLQGSMTYIAYGLDSLTYLNCTFTDQISFDGRILTNDTSSTLSRWFVEQLEQLGIIEELSDHVFFAVNAGTVIIDNPNVSIAVPAFEAAARSFVINNGSLTLTDYINWGSVMITRDVLYVDSRYSVKLNHGFQAHVTADFDEDSSMSITCDRTLTEHIEWYLGSGRPSLTWNGPACTGLVATVTCPSSYEFLGSGQVNASLDISVITPDTSSITLMNSALQMNSNFAFNFTSDSLSMHLRALLSTTNHSVLLSEPAPWCELVITDTAVVNITSATLQRVAFPGRDLIYHWRPETIEPYDANDTACLVPEQMCSPNFWIDVQAHGTTFCEPHCTDYGLAINTTLAVDCSVPLHAQSWSVFIHPSSFEPDGKSAETILIGILYTLIVVILSLFASAGYTMLGGWVEFVLLAAFFKVYSANEEWNPTIRMWLVAANEVVVDIFSGWQCDSEVWREGAFWAMSGLAVNSIVLTILANKHIREKYTDPAARFVANFSLLYFTPYVISRITRKSSYMAIPAIITYAIMVIQNLDVQWRLRIVTQQATRSMRLKNGAAIAITYLICVAACVLAREDLEVNPIVVTWTLAALVFLNAVPYAVRMLLVDDILPIYFINPSTRQEKRVNYSCLAMNTIAGLALVTTLHYAPTTLPTAIFFLLLVLWNARLINLAIYRGRRQIIRRPQVPRPPGPNNNNEPANEKTPLLQKDTAEKEEYSDVLLTDSSGNNTNVRRDTSINNMFDD